MNAFAKSATARILEYVALPCVHCTDPRADFIFRIAYWIAFGPHGPRALPPPDENWKVFRGTMIGIAVSVVIFFAIRAFARGDPKTMTEQYQKMTNEYLKVSHVSQILHNNGV